MNFYGHCWSQMVPEILDLILRKLDLPDYLEFGKVCTSWRSVFLSRCSVSRPPPCMLLIPKPQISPVERVPLWCLYEGQFLKLKYPRTNESYHKPILGRWEQLFLGCSMGWLVVKSMFQLELMNPTTTQWISLPPTPSWGNEIPQHLKNIQVVMLNHIVMSAAPTSKDCILVLRRYYPYWIPSRFAWCRLCEYKWTVFDLPGRRIFAFDMVFHKGALYVVGRYGEICIYAFSPQPNMIGRASVGFTNTNICYGSLKLVEAGEELFCVLWEFGNDEELENDEDESIKLYVYRMLNDSEWTRVQGLGDRVFLIGEYGGRSYFNQDLMGSGFEANCIYMIYCNRCGKRILTKFCMADGSNQEISLPPIFYESIEWIRPQAW